jgi:hypothetical protein
MERLDQAAIDLIEQDVRGRFAAGTLHGVAVLQYGDDPGVEPGEIVIRVTVETSGGADGDGDKKDGDGDGDKRDRDGDKGDGDKEVFDAFHRAHRDAIQKLRRDLQQRFPEARRLEFVSNEVTRQKIMRLRLAQDEPSGDLTPVMARLGPMDLETLDTLITAGIAANRAQGVRWALARIRDRPAYAQLRERAREIEDLKSQF